MLHIALSVVATIGCALIAVCISGALIRDTSFGKDERMFGQIGIAIMFIAIIAAWVR